MTQQAAFDAWLATECGLAPHETWALSQQELLRLKLGWVTREQQKTADGEGTAGADGQRRKIRNGQQRERDRLLSDVGIQ